MFEVVEVRYRLLTKLVKLRALADMSGTEALIGGGPHSVTAFKAPYHFERGFTFELSFPIWVRVMVGKRLSLERILKHPYVQRELIAKAKQLARR